MDIRRLSYKQICRQHELLDAACEAGTLTEAVLDAAVRAVVEDPGDGPPESIGFGWIARNINAFAMVVPDKLAFMRRHLENRYFAGVVVLVPDLFRLLPEAARAGYLRDAIMLHGARNQGWVSTALALGIPRETIASITLAKLEEVDADQLRYANFLDDFVKYGHGRIEGNWLSPDSVWGVLTDDQFCEAMMICARKAPEDVLRAHATIGMRAVQFKASIIREAATQIDVVGDPAPFACLSLNERIAFARRLAPLTDGWRHSGTSTMRFIAELLIEEAAVSGAAVATALFQEFKPVLLNGHAPTLYRAIRAASQMASPEREARPDAAGMLDKILNWLESERLPAQGYVFGVIEQGVRTDRRHAGQPQLQVWLDPCVYVQSNASHRYCPRPGDLVMFHPGRATHLARNVRATQFIPCNPAILEY